MLKVPKAFPRTVYYNYFQLLLLHKLLCTEEFWFFKHYSIILAMSHGMSLFSEFITSEKCRI